jgi:putative endonuclease
MASPSSADAAMCSRRPGPEVRPPNGPGNGPGVLPGASRTRGRVGDVIFTVALRGSSWRTRSLRRDSASVRLAPGMECAGSPRALRRSRRRADSHQGHVEARANPYNRFVFFVYIVRCADGTLYTGLARDPEARVNVHNSGKGAKYTRSRRPVTLVYVEPCGSLSDAMKREHQLKPWSRAKKEALVASQEVDLPCRILAAQ